MVVTVTLPLSAPVALSMLHACTPRALHTPLGDIRSSTPRPIVGVARCTGHPTPVCSTLRILLVCLFYRTLTGISRLTIECPSHPDYIRVLRFSSLHPPYRPPGLLSVVPSVWVRPGPSFYLDSCFTARVLMGFIPPLACACVVSSPLFTLFLISVTPRPPHVLGCMGSTCIIIIRTRFPLG